jgi:hypothetical protein
MTRSADFIEVEEIKNYHHQRVRVANGKSRFDAARQQVPHRGIFTQGRAC